MNTKDHPLETALRPPPRAAAPANGESRACTACGEPITEVVESRPEYCFVCAVHVVCACADEPE